jgi:hypothetical protein
MEVSKRIIDEIDALTGDCGGLPLGERELRQLKQLAEWGDLLNTEPRWTAKEIPLNGGMYWHTPTLVAQPMLHNCRCSTIDLWNKPTRWQRVRRWAARLLRKLASRCDDNPHVYQH